MALFIQTPRSETVLKDLGPYRRRLNALTGKGTNVQRRLRRGGLANYEPTLQATLLALIEGSRKQPVFYDVGAHIGLFSALLSVIFRRSGIQALAFEPTPSTFARAVKLRDKNALRYLLHPIALSEHCGETTLYLSTKAETSNSLNGEFRPGSAPISIRCETIDRIVANGAPPPTLIKIDVETFEPQVILGGLETIKTHRPWITCEFLAGTDEQRLTSALGELEGAGYSFYQILPDVPWTKLQMKDVVQNRSSAAGARDWLAAPKPLSDAFFEKFKEWHFSVKSCGLASNKEAESRDAKKTLLADVWTAASSPKPLPTNHRLGLPNKRKRMNRLEFKEPSVLGEAPGQWSRALRR